MPPKIVEAELDAKLTELEKARTWSPRLVSKLEAVLRAEDDFAPFRLNPLAFAAERGLDEQEAIDLFLHACKAGLLQMNWGIVCPNCGDLLESFRSLKVLHNQYTCGMCHIKGQADFDDFIQVSFTVSPSVRDLVFHHPESLGAEDFTYRYHFTREGRMSAGGPTFPEALRALGRGVGYLPAKATTSFTAEMTPGFLMGWDLIHNHGFMCQIQPGGAAAASFTFQDGRYAPESGSLAVGRVSLSFENRSGDRGHMMLVNMPPDHFEKKGAMIFDPFLTGRRLITNQTFRDLYRTETVGGNEGIGVKDTTILFTDLKGSTEMYDKIGDLQAFALVRQHFDRLGKVVFRQAGAIVKTIGDAVMATFNTPVGAVTAALQMLDEIEAFNKEHGAQALILKIGVHHGTSIAVTLNDRLDYFGQTVNIAARVQGLAGAEELYITQDVMDSPGVKEHLAGYQVTPESAMLKGVAGAMQVYRITEKGAASAPRTPAAKPAATAAAKPRPGRAAATPT
ncbi:MAG TPA: DUF5939 domain-containing protein, partial [Candidatus Binatia bacterium]|nr:DUF5939 domain-containing protein [Candidatus Binatia bacterium]